MTKPTFKHYVAVTLRVCRITALHQRD